MITAIGTASNTQTNPKINHQIIILTNTTTGLTPKVLFINNGTKTLPSNHWMKITTPTRTNTPEMP